MIVFLKGILVEKQPGRAILDVGGVGYEVHMAASSLEKLPAPGAPVSVLVVESFGIYGGGASLYGFAEREERDLFETLRGNVPGTGAKKALEYLDKAAKSLPDFRRAILEKDARILAGVFGFSKKTADKLILALKDKIEAVPSGAARRFSAAIPEGSQVAQALLNLGYRAPEIKGVLAIVDEQLAGRGASLEETLRLALKNLKK